MEPGTEPVQEPRRLGLGPASRPPLPQFYVPRARLLDRLDEGAGRPLTAVVAPPGAGKSVVLAAWARDRCPDSVWVTCEEVDRDPLVLFGHLVAALRASQGDRWLEASELLDERDPDLVAVVDMIVGGLADEPAVLVLDDIHVAHDAEPLLSRCVERLPPGSRFVTGSRGDPPFALHRRRADGGCLEVREAELRLTPDEVAELVDALGATVSAEATTVLAERTDGWVAGVQMAAIALRSEPNPEQFLADFSGSVRVVSDFLVEEVLARQPEGVQRFLLWSSVLDRLEPGACAAVTGDDDAAAILRHLDTSALFVIPTDQDSYRYHQLFRDMLRYQLRATNQDAARESHRRAAGWYEQERMLAPALRHLVAAGEEDRAYAILESELGRVFLDGGAVAIRALVTAVSDGDTSLAASRMVTIATALAMAGALSAADTWLQRAIRNSDQLDDLGRRRLLSARAYVAGQRGDAGRALPLIDQIDPHDSDDDTLVATPAFEVLVRGWVQDYGGARDAAARTRDFRSLGLVYEEIMTGGALSWVACVEGSLREAGPLADQALATADELGVSEHSTLSEPLRTRGWLCFERGDLRGAEAALERSLMLVERSSPARAVVSAAALARAWVSDGRLGDAREALATGRALLASGIDSPLVTLLDGLEARIAMLEGDLDRAAALVRALPSSVRRARLEARLFLDAHDPSAARDVLDSCVPSTPRERLDLLMLRARCDDELAASTADQSLTAAIEAARPQGFTFALAEELCPVSARLGALLHAAPLDDFAEAVLQLLDSVVPLTGAPKASPLPSPLTERELVVLRYLPSRLTTSEIAAELYVSVNTVRTHTKAVYRKLGVSSRRDAVAEARRLAIR